MYVCMCIKHALGWMDGYFCTPLCCTKVCKEEQQHLFPSPDDMEIGQLYKLYEQQFITVPYGTHECHACIA